MDVGAGDGEQAAASREYHVSIEGDTFAPVVVGDHNFVVDARNGSTVSVVTERERPRPVRRDQVRLLPRRQSVPLGREADLAKVRAAVEAGGVVQLYGPPGIGTSMLLRRTARTRAPRRREWCTSMPVPAMSPTSRRRSSRSATTRAAMCRRLPSYAV